MNGDFEKSIGVATTKDYVVNPFRFRVQDLGFGSLSDGISWARPCGPTACAAATLPPGFVDWFRC